MAAGGSDPSESLWWSSGSNEWFNSMLTAAKEKSSAALQKMSKDLQEFGSTIQKDTTQAVASSASVIGQNLKPDDDVHAEKEKSTTDQLRDGFLSFLSSVSQTLATPENVSAEEYVVHPQDSHLFDQTKARLHAMQVDPATYCNEPDEPLDDYHKWLESFNVDNMKGDISELLVANSQVRSIYTKLVPAAVSHGEFWGRYFYKVHLLGQDEDRRSALKERAEMISSQNLDEELGWGDEDETWDTVPETAKETSPDRLERDETTKTDINLPQEDKEESLNVKEAPNRTESDTVVETNNKTDVIVDNDKSSSPNTSQTLEAVKENATETDLTEEVKELTIETEKNVQDVVKEESSNGSSGNKDSSLGDEWEKDFDDIEITEEDIRNAQLVSKNKTLNEDNDSDEWENWE